MEIKWLGNGIIYSWNNNQNAFKKEQFNALIISAFLEKAFLSLDVYI